MVSRPFPERNPFPPQGTFTVLDEDAGDDQNVDSTLPTIETDAISRMQAQVTSYLASYTGEFHRGRVMYLKGQHGSGKTHAINYLRKKVLLLEISTTAGVEKPLQLFAKALKSDPMEVFRALIVSLGYERTRNAALKYFGVVTADEYLESPRKRDGGELRSSLRDSPENVYDMLDESLVGTVPVIDRLLAEIESIRRLEGTDLLYAMKYLLSRDMSEDADEEMARLSFKWMTGQSLAIDEKSSLGVKENLQDPDLAACCLLILIHILGRIRTPVIIYIDQVERLTVRKSRSNNGADWLQFLADGIILENAMLVMSGNPDSWSHQNPDMRQRVGTNLIDFSEVTFDEARSIIWIYLEASDGNFRIQARPSSSRLDLSPFSVGALKSIVARSGGNIRRILQLSSLLYEEALGVEKRQIDSKFTQKILAENNAPPVTKQQVQITLEQMSRRKGILVGKYENRDENIVDMILRKGNRESSAVYIQISEAIFVNDEAQRARDQIDNLRELEKFDLYRPVILIVLGYVSREIIELLKSAPFYSVRIVRANSFDTDMQAILGEIEDALSISQSDEALRLKGHQNIDDAANHLEMLHGKRQNEVEALSTALSSLVKEIEALKSQSPKSGEAPLGQKQHRIWPLIVIPPAVVTISFIFSFSLLEFLSARHDELWIGGLVPVVESLTYIQFVIALAWGSLFAFALHASISGYRKIYYRVLDLVVGSKVPPHLVARGALIGLTLGVALYYIFDQMFTLLIRL